MRSYRLYKKVSKSIYLKEIFCLKFIFSFSLMLILLIESNGLKNCDAISSILIVINMLLLTLAYFKDNSKSFTLYKTALMFIGVFLIIAPASQISHGYAPWGYYCSQSVQHGALLVVTFWILSLFIGKLYFNRKPKIPTRKSYPYKNFMSSNKVKSNILLLFVLIDALILQLFVGFQNVFERGAFEFSTGGAFDIAIDFLLKTYPIMILCLIRCDKRFFKKHKNLFVLIWSYALLLNNPISNSRFLSLSAMLGLFFLAFPKALSFKFIDLIVFGSICFLFPLASQFKQSPSLNLSDFSLKDIYLSVDFDAFCFIEQGIIYYQEFGLCGGTQIISSIFFFVPRSIIPIKGDISGAVIVDSLHPGSYNNVSCPFLVEGLLDFGYFGLFLYGVIFSIVINFLDLKYFSKTSASLFKYVYPFLIGYLIYIMRGSLAPTVLRLFGFLLPFLLLTVFMFISKRRVKILSNNSCKILRKERRKNELLF